MAKTPSNPLSPGYYKTAGLFDNARYRYLVEQSGDMISTHRPGDWAYTSVNQAVKHISGYLSEELIGKPAYDLFHPDDAQAMKRRTIPAIYQHGVRTFRYRSLHKDGNYYWLESTHRSIRDPESHELIEIIAVTRDITKQVEAESASKRLAQVVEASTDLVIFCDQDLLISYMNSSALKGFNIEADHYPHLESLLAPDSYQKLKTDVLKSAERNGSWHGELRLKSTRFAERYRVLQEVITHPALSDSDSKALYSLIIRDLSQQKFAERESRQHQSDLAHANRVLSLGEMASGLAHEINQPLATTLNYANGASRQIESGRITEVEALQPVLGKIVLQAQRAASIVKRLRALVKKTPYQRREIFLNPVCLDVVDFINHDLQKTGVEVRLHLTEANPAIEADRVQIEQVLVNLLRNALDAYEDLPREHLFIDLLTRVEGRSVLISVSDYGRGIPENIREGLFQPYVSSKRDGLGMGLSITRSIVEAHGGTIDLDADIEASAEAPSTRFIIRLPRIT